MWFPSLCHALRECMLCVEGMPLLWMRNHCKLYLAHSTKSLVDRKFRVQYGFDRECRDAGLM